MGLIRLPTVSAPRTETCWTGEETRLRGRNWKARLDEDETKKVREDGNIGARQVFLSEEESAAHLDCDVRWRGWTQRSRDGCRGNRMTGPLWILSEGACRAPSLAPEGRLFLFIYPNTWWCIYGRPNPPKSLIPTTFTPPHPLSFSPFRISKHWLTIIPDGLSTQTFQEQHYGGSSIFTRSNFLVFCTLKNIIKGDAKRNYVHWLQLSLLLPHMF